VAKRKSLTKKTRFEVFKRDGFQCQYCGRSAPDVVLQADHITPVSKGGDNDILNLITSCEDCNAGKSDRELDDDSILAKQRAQLQGLNERREQLEMMLKWREGLASVQDMSVEAVKERFAAVVPGWFITDATKDIKKLLRKYPLNDVLDAVETAAESYVRMHGEKATRETAELAWQKVPGILHVRSQPEEQQALYYVRGIMRNRYNYVNERCVMPLLRAALEAGADVEDLKAIARENRNWTNFSLTIRHTYGVEG
jgi:hypothetical protein